MNRKKAIVVYPGGARLYQPENVGDEGKEVYAVIAPDGILTPLATLPHVWVEAAYACDAHSLREMKTGEVLACENGEKVFVVKKDAKQFVVSAIDVADGLIAAYDQFTDYVMLFTDAEDSVVELVQGDASSALGEASSYSVKRAKHMTMVRLRDEGAMEETLLSDAQKRLKARFLDEIKSIREEDFKNFVRMNGVVYADGSNIVASWFEMDVAIVNREELDRLQSIERKYRQLIEMVRHVTR